MFLIYINDISSSVVSITKLFANDTSLLHIITDIYSKIEFINDLNTNDNWTKQHKQIACSTHTSKAITSEHYTRLHISKPYNIQLEYGYEGYRQFPLPRDQVYFQRRSRRK